MVLQVMHLQKKESTKFTHLFELLHWPNQPLVSFVLFLLFSKLNCKSWIFYHLDESNRNWLSPEVLSLFVFHEVRNLSKDEERHIIKSLVHEQ